MAAITPPPVLVQYKQLPERLTDGAEIRFTLWFGPLPVRWVACIEGVTSGGFLDRQIDGPFHHWIHRHSFVPVSQDRTEVRDEVEVQLKKSALWGLFGLGMWLSLPVLFRYRVWKTRRILSKPWAK